MGILAESGVYQESPIAPFSGLPTFPTAAFDALGTNESMSSVDLTFKKVIKDTSIL